MIPETITLVRHGQSCGNQDKSIFQTITDDRIDLTPEGAEQAQAAIPVIRSVIGTSRALFYTSPFLRCRHTAQIIRAGFEKDQITLIENNLLYERKFGNLSGLDTIRDVYEQYRAQGPFYRPSCGDSLADVFTRTEVFRTVMKARWSSERHPPHVVIIGHNTALKTFLMAELQIRVSHFSELCNIGNAQSITLRPKEGEFGFQYLPDELPIGITETHINSTYINSTYL